MKLLLIDTCGMAGSVAFADIARYPHITATASFPGRAASERLVATIRDLIAKPGSDLRSFDAVVVVSGPGSFTGVRVGLSAAKGLCEALDLPLVALSRLALLAHNAAPPAGTAVFALLDAGRGEFYLGIYADGRPAKETLATRAELIDALAETRERNGAVPIIVTCDLTVADALAGMRPLLIPEPTAQDALPLAMLRLESRRFDEVATIDANYLRRTDAEIFARRAAISGSETSADSPAR